MIVLDASVILKWIFEEPETPAALQWRDSHVAGKEKIAAPELLYYELANVLATKTSLSAENASSIFQHLLNMEMVTFTLGELEFAASIQMAHRYKVSVYDASYAVLAQRFDCSFLTADRKLYQRIKSLGSVRLLTA
jgi:predicted nucleic acid-binding protein